MGYLWLAGLLGGCAAETPPPVGGEALLAPTQVELRIGATAGVNPGSRGEGAPVVVRIYELKGVSAFNSADFFALYDRDQSVLGPELVAKREVLLRPAETQSLMLTPAPDVLYVAAFAAFRNLESARWRMSVPIQAHARNVLDLKLGGSQLALTPVSGVLQGVVNAGLSAVPVPGMTPDMVPAPAMPPPVPEDIVPVPAEPAAVAVPVPGTAGMVVVPVSP